MEEFETIKEFETRKALVSWKQNSIGLRIKIKVERPGF